MENMRKQNSGGGATPPGSQRAAESDQQVIKRFDTTPETNYNSNMMNYKSDTLKQFQDDKLVSETFRNHKPNFIHLTHSTNLKKAAFTLSEVLITLGIIGIVAAMTIPTITHNIQDMVLNNQFKKFYSTFKPAFLNVQTLEGRPIKCHYWVNNPYAGKCTSIVVKDENGKNHRVCQETGKPVPEDYSGPFSECMTLYDEVFHKRLKLAKFCKNNALANGCLPENIKGYDKVILENNPDSEDAKETMEFSDSNIKNNYPVYVLQDGTYIIQYVNTSGRPVFAFDINGKKGPNKWGYDLYGVILRGDQNGIQYFRNYLTKEKGGKTLEERLEAVGLK